MFSLRNNRAFTVFGPVIAVAVVLVIMVVSAQSGYEISLLTTACVNMLVLAGLNVIAGYGGQLALGQAAFTGIGAYATVIAVVDLHLPTVLALVLAPIVSIIFAVIIGLPSLRLKGLYFAVATLAFGFILNQILLQGGAVTGGPDGRGIGMKPLSLFGFVFSDPFHQLVLAAFVALLALLAMHSLMRTWFGWGLRAAKVSEPASSGIGTPVFRTRLAAFVISGAFGGIGGSLLAFEQLYVSPTTFTFSASIDLFMVLFLGGLGTFLGPVIGAAILYIFTRWFSAFPEAEPFILGIVFLAALRFFPLGVGGFINGVVARLAAKKREDERVAALDADTSQLTADQLPESSTTRAKVAVATQELVK